MGRRRFRKPTPMSDINETNETGAQTGENTQTAKASEETKKLPPYPQTHSDAVKAAIEAGDIVEEDSTVTAKINKVGADGKETKVSYEKPYKVLTPKTMQGALVLADGKEENLLKMVGQSYDSGVRVNVRSQIVTQAQGPDTQLLKAAKALAAVTGRPEDVILAELRQNPDVAKALAASV